ncbi:hypothetical protein MLD38_025864 [Melastoma candidum]|uniref:Uncharacterized protein n=1 Tax=Melastoma candidum TaxID=119954 RepID=A0ACB9NWF6_9MYRT|nr:hypothetical protein MLD38_025864 [Melastoma candidum]
MDFGRPISILLLIGTVVLIMLPCDALEFVVGGKDGWVLHPSEGYNHWAERNRFQVNDTLYFKYKRGNDSVLVVSSEDYNSCTTIKPIQSLSDGNSTFKFDRSGPFFFISGIADRCNAGQRLIVVVLAVRPKVAPPAPGALPPTPAPATTPTSPSLAPGTSAPGTPVPAPSSPTSGSARQWKLGGGLVGVMVMTLGHVIVGLI